MLLLCFGFLLSAALTVILFALLLRYSIGTAQRVAATTLALYLAMLAVATGGHCPVIVVRERREATRSVRPHDDR